MIPVPAGVKIWIATGHTDMRRGMNSLARQVEQQLGKTFHDGDLYVFRGRRGDLVKILWSDALGVSIYAKRLERGKFVWPSAKDGAIALTASQLIGTGAGLDRILQRRTDEQTFINLNDISLIALHLGQLRQVAKAVGHVEEGGGVLQNRCEVYGRSTQTNLRNSADCSNRELPPDRQSSCQNRQIANGHDGRALWQWIYLRPSRWRRWITRLLVGRVFRRRSRRLYNQWLEYARRRLPMG